MTIILRVTFIWWPHMESDQETQMPAIKESVRVMWDDNLHSEGTLPDTYIESHVGNTETKPGVCSAVTHKAGLISSIALLHETDGTWHDTATLLMQISRCITIITGKTTGTIFLFPCLSIAPETRNAVFQNTMITKRSAVEAIHTVLIFNMFAYRLVLAHTNNHSCNKNNSKIHISMLLPLPLVPSPLLDNICAMVIGGQERRLSELFCTVLTV